MEDNGNLIEVITVEGMMEAEILKAKLSNFNIPVIMEFETAGRLLGITMNGLGKVKLMVTPEYYEKALDILSGDDSLPENATIERENTDE